MARSKKGKQVRPSSNWFALKNSLTTTSTRHQRRHDKSRATESQPDAPEASSSLSTSVSDSKDGESLSALRKMIFGQIEHSSNQQMPGKYLALDCEMVGVGTDGLESSLARVSLVNYYGVVLLDEFVRQRERVVDYRTRFSGVREKDLINATPFNEVQKRVAELLIDRILVGHAVHNDLKALLLSHPWSQTRDTQYYANKYKVTKSRYIALRNLVQQELKVTIQDGEHSSVTDARATMAVFRLHRKEWEKGNKRPAMNRDRDGLTSKKQKTEKDEERNSNTGVVQKKGVSSGLGTVLKHAGPRIQGAEKWWEVLGDPMLEAG